MYATRKYNDTLIVNLLERIAHCPLFRSFTNAILILSSLLGCGPSTEALEAVDYTPLPGDEWKVSTPAE